MCRAVIFIVVDQNILIITTMTYDEHFQSFVANDVCSTWITNMFFQTKIPFAAQFF